MPPPTDGPLECDQRALAGRRVGVFDYKEEEGICYRFPSFHYTRDEWLELCDGYANAFLCGGFTPFQQVRFVSSRGKWMNT